MSAIQYFAKLAGAAILAAALCFLLSACGGGGSSVAGGGIGGTGAVASGTINGFGSVIVNGQAFDDTSARINVNGQPATRADLRVGMVVEVRGKQNSNGTRSASDITFASDLRGPVEAGSVNLQNNSFVALGALYRVDGTTVYDGVTDLAALAKLPPDTVVELSGFFDPRDSSILTSRVQVVGPFTPATSTLHVKGVVQALDGSTFNLRTLHVSANLAADKLPAGGLKNGQFVRVTSNQLPVASGSVLTLTATQIELADMVLEANDGDEVSVAGLAASCSAPVCNTFALEELPISVSNATTFEPNTRTAADLSNGADIEVEGKVSGKTLAARKISFRQSSNANIRIEATVEDAAGAPQNSIQILGKAVFVDSVTQFEDKTRAAASFNLTNFASLIAIGRDHLAVRAFKTTENGVEKLIAARVERNNDNNIVLQGPVDEKTLPSLKILGLIVQSGTGTAFKRLDDSDFPNANAFFNSIQAGGSTATIVKARGVAGTGSVAVDASNGELEIESP